MSAVGELLDASRLTTLTGPGGAGKTRLAVAAAREQLRAMPDGVWLIELAPVTDGTEIVPTALATLGLRDQALIASAAVRASEVGHEPLGRRHPRSARIPIHRELPTGRYDARLDVCLCRRSARETSVDAAWSQHDLRAI